MQPVNEPRVSDPQRPTQPQSTEPQPKESSEGNESSLPGALEQAELQHYNTAVAQSQDQPIVEPHVAKNEQLLLVSFPESPAVDVTASDLDSWQIIDHTTIEPEMDVEDPALEPVIATDQDPIKEDFFAKQLEVAMTTVIPVQDLCQHTSILSSADSAVPLEAAMTPEEAQKLDQNSPRNFVVIVLVLILTTYIFS